MISVIITTLNAEKPIAECLNCLRNQTVDPKEYEIIVVDLGSIDQTICVAEEAEVQVIKLNNGTYSQARNLGLEKANGDIICFLDADCYPEATWLKNLTSPFQDSQVIGCKGKYITDQKELVARFCQLEYEEKYHRLTQAASVDFIDAYSAAYQREIVIANGGFDEQFSMLDDQELSYRLASRGYSLRFEPTAAVYHHHFIHFQDYLFDKARKAYWKSQVVRRFPSQFISDSYTPSLLKIQMTLVPLFLVSTFLSLFEDIALIGSLFLLLVFLFTTLPFVRMAWRLDKQVAFVSPFLIAARALALLLGYGAGVIWASPNIRPEKSTISGFSYLAKRFFDITGGLFGMLVTLCLSPIIAPAIWLTSPGPLLFRQERVGLGGRSFTMYKFRTMDENAEQMLEDLITIRELAEPSFKLKNDPRITYVGRILRRWSLDELPQFWNVLVGDMSLVGPRPEEKIIVARYNDFQRRRLSVKPGITGPMQINGRADLPFDKRIQLELDYINQYSLWKDLNILIKTIPAVILGRGAR